MSSVYEKKAGATGLHNITVRGRPVMQRSEKTLASENKRMPQIRTALCNVYPNDTDYFVTQIRTPHMGLAYLSACAKQAGFKIDIHDSYYQAISDDEMFKRLVEGRYDVIGFTTYEIGILGTVDLVRRLRKADYEGVIILGGYQATFIYEELLTDIGEIDYVLTGECEQSFVDLLKALDARVREPTDRELNVISGLAMRTDNGIVQTQRSVLVTDLNQLPLPDLEKCDNQEVQIMVSRGCTAKCSFCAIKEFFAAGRGKGIRIRTVDSAIEEIRDRIERFGTKRFVFTDDEFFVLEALSKGWVGEFVDRVRKEGLNFKIGGIKLRSDSLLRYREQVELLKELGLDSAFIGVETMDDRVLSEVFHKDVKAEVHRMAVKTLKSMDISPSVGMIPFHPYTSVEELEKNFTFYKVDVGIFNYLYPFHRYSKLIIFPGTSRLIHKLEQDGLLTSHGLGRYSWKYLNPELDLIYRTFQTWDDRIAGYRSKIKSIVDSAYKFQRIKELDLPMIEKATDCWATVNNEFVENVIIESKIKVLSGSVLEAGDFIGIIDNYYSQLQSELELLLPNEVLGERVEAIEESSLSVG